MKKKMLKTALAVFLIILAATAAFADDANTFEEYDNALGGFYGEIGGAGLSWQRWNGRLGVEAAAGLNYLQENNSYYSTSWNTDPVNVDLFDYNIGAQVQYMLYQDSYENWFDGNLYLFAGGTHSGVFRSTYSYEEVVDADDYKTYPTTGHTAPYYVPGFSAGFGFGFETVFFSHFSLPFEIGLCGIWEYGSIMPVDAGIKFQGGLRYRF